MKKLVRKTEKILLWNPFFYNNRLILKYYIFLLFILEKEDHYEKFKGPEII